jgi:hypothetical protein
MKPGQNPMAHAIAILAGLQVMHPDPTVNQAAEALNGCICHMVEELIGRPAAEAMFAAALADVAPALEEHFGVRVLQMSTLNKQAAAMTDDLITKLRKEGL